MGGDISNLAVCTNEGRCTDPKYRFWDGGYIDNTGVCMLVGTLQEKHGLGVTLRIFIVDSTNLDTSALFGATEAAGPNDDRQIFDSSDSNAAQELSKTRTISYVRRHVQTVPNRRFGIQGGQHVEVFTMLATAGYPAAVAVDKAGDIKTGATLAQDVYSAMLALLQAEVVKQQRIKRGN